MQRLIEFLFSSIQSMSFSSLNAIQRNKQTVQVGYIDDDVRVYQ